MRTTNSPSTVGLYIYVTDLHAGCQELIGAALTQHSKQDIDYVTRKHYLHSCTIESRLVGGEVYSTRRMSKFKTSNGFGNYCFPERFRDFR